MPVFEYVAIDAAGRQTKGTVDAENIRSARQRLRAQKLFPTEVKEGTVEPSARTKDVARYIRATQVSLKDLSVATRQLATLVAAGLPLVSSLAALAEQTENTTLKRILIQVKEEVEEGATFAKSLNKYPKVFPNLYINMVASGEASGTLDTVLGNVAEYLEGQVELRRKIWSALTYPILMLFMCGAVVVGLLVFVIPRIVEIFVKQGAILPLPTRIVIGLSDFLIAYWYLLAFAVIGITMGVREYYRKDAGKDRLDRWVLALPLYGPLFIKVSTARVSKTLSTLLSSGVGLLGAIDITKNITTNVHMRRALEDARTGVQEGKSLARELTKSGVFPVMLSHMIAIGEKSGALEGMLDKAGKAYEAEVNATLGRLTSLLEPLMMVFVGGIVLIIVVSVLLPMADLITIIQK
ncbi:MAG: type II secretion system protein GspF [Proteobacteria bacterium]|nr:type II secretion system protein GspF [Pseudomonadota bacterium]